MYLPIINKQYFVFIEFTTKPEKDNMDNNVFS